jgi:hypothetical protein
VSRHPDRRRRSPEKEIHFYDKPKTWRNAVTKHHPQAKIKTRAGIHRAYVGDRKVGAFGRLP